MDKTEQQKNCIECRECCEYIEIPTTMLSLEVVDFWIERGEQFYINPASGVLHVRFYKPCRHLTENGCAIYDNRPMMCSAYICNHKDKSVKVAKEQLCESSMATVRQAVENWKEDKHTKNALKMWKENGNDLQPSKSDEDAGVPDGSTPV